MGIFLGGGRERQTESKSVSDPQDSDWSEPTCGSSTPWGVKEKTDNPNTGNLKKLRAARVNTAANVKLCEFMSLSDDFSGGRVRRSLHHG